MVPSLEYYKKNLLVKNLDLLLTANYNHNITNNVDTASRAYNWRGDFYEKAAGENSLTRTVNLKIKTGMGR